MSTQVDDKAVGLGSPNSNHSSAADEHDNEKHANNMNPHVTDGRPSSAVGTDAAPAVAPTGDAKSYGVSRIEAIVSVMTRTDRIFVFFGVFIAAYAYGLDGTLRWAYQPYATADFDSHSLLSTVSVLRAVIAVAAQPTAAKIADVFGRVELIIVSVFFYTLGSVVQTVAQNIATFAGGAVIYQVGYTMIMLLLQVVIGDITSTRSRLLFSYIPALPFAINTWVSGDISQAVIDTTTWRWGIGMWCIIYPVCTLPLIVSLLIVGRRARKAGLLDTYKTPFQELGFTKGMVYLFWRLDVIGIVLLVAMFALLLAPLTLAGGFSSKWAEAEIIAPLVIGFVLIPVFIYSQLKAPHPLMPFRLMKDRGVWGALGIALFLNFAWYMQGNYLFTVLQVAFDMSVMTATRVTSLYSFTSTVVGFFIGLVVFKLRRLKVFIVAGTCLFLVAFGLLIHYRGAVTNSAKAGVIGAQVLLGIAGGMFPYAAQASLQSSLDHENLAVMTAVYLGIYNVGSAFGNTLSGAFWSQLLPHALETRLARFNNPDLITAVYGNPFAAILEIPVGTPERDAVIAAYQHVQRLLCITGICLCVPLICFAMATRNPKLNDKQTLADNSSDEESVAQAETKRGPLGWLKR